MTLYELVLRQKMTGESDSQLIAEWFNSNDMASEGIELIYKLSKKKIEDDKWRYGWLASDLSMYSATQSLMKTFGIKNGCKLDSIIRRFIICRWLNDDFEKKYPQDIEWLKEIIPTKELPFVFWRPFAEYLEEKGIYFKDKGKM